MSSLSLSLSVVAHFTSSSLVSLPFSPDLSPQLLLAYLASHALRQVTGGATVSYQQIRDSLHAEYPVSSALRPIHSDLWSL